MEYAEIARQVRAFIVEQFLFGDDSPSLQDQTPLLEEGIVDSTGFLELTGFLEKTFKIHIGRHELTPENLDSIANVARFVAGKLSQAGAQQATLGSGPQGV